MSIGWANFTPWQSLAGGILIETSTSLYVPVQQHSLAFLLPQGELFDIDSEHGHEGFLIDAAAFEPRIRRFVQRLPTVAAERRPKVGGSSLRYVW